MTSFYSYPSEHMGGLRPGDVDSEGVVAFLRGDSVSWWYECRVGETEKSPGKAPDL